MQMLRFHSSNFGFRHDLGHSRSPNNSPSSSTRTAINSRFYRQLRVSKLLDQKCKFQHNRVQRRRAMDEGSLGISSFDDWAGNVMTSDYAIFSSDGEDSDGEILVTPINDVDMPAITKKFVAAEDAFTATAHRLAMFGKRHKKHRITHGFVTSLGLIAFLTSFLALVDWCAWRIVRQPLDNFYFLSPFIASAFLVACAGYVSIPLLKLFNIRQKFKRKWLPVHFSKKGPPTIGGLFFIPIGVAVAKFMSGSSTEISGMLAVTLAFAAVGLLDDTVSLIKYQNSGLSGGTRIILEVAIAACFSFWLYTTNIPSPYGMKMVVQLPPPFALVHLGKCYIFLTLFTFILMANGHYLTDGLDGLGGGTSALSFVAMSTAVLPICSGLQIQQTKEGIMIHQQKYIKELIRKFGMQDAHPMDTPMVPDKKLTLDEHGKCVDETTYRGMIGSLLYLTASRPDIMFSVCVCARFQSCPKESHMIAVKRILRYLIGTSNLYLWYPLECNFDLVGYSDADYAGCSLDRKSTSGFATFVGPCVVTWGSKKQNSVALSTAEAEYIAAGLDMGWPEDGILFICPDVP